MKTRRPAPDSRAPTGPEDVASDALALRDSATPADTSPPATRLEVVAAFAAVYLIWGSTYLAIRFAIETMPPFLMAGARFLTAGAILYAARRAVGAPKPDARQWAAAAVIGGLLLFGGNGGVVWAEQLVPSGIAALIVAIVPLWMVVLDWARRGGARPSGRVLIGVAIGLAGVALLVGPDAFNSGDAAGAIHPVGAIVLVLASLSWAVGSLYSRGAPVPEGAPLLATAMQMLCGGALLILAGIVTGEPGAVDVAGISAKSALALLYLIVFGSLIGYTAYVWLLRVQPAARVATYAYVNPVVAVFLGWAFADEPISARIVVAAAIIIGSVALITVSRRRS
ncbi:MAG: drug/metabolite exporter YedA [Longimicrobiales bacterium]